MLVATDLRADFQVSVPRISQQVLVSCETRNQQNSEDVADDQHRSNKTFTAGEILRHQFDQFVPNGLLEHDLAERLARFLVSVLFTHSRVCF